MQNKIISINNVSLTLGACNLFRKLSLSVSQGEMLGISGTSGCGKTSLFRLILGFVGGDNGNVEICGQSLSVGNIRYCRSQIAYLPQELSFSHETVAEAVQMLFSLKVNESVRFSKDRLMKYWHKLSLSEELYDRPLRSVSGGQRQRIMLASCAMLDKKLWLLDEPTSQLDVDMVFKVIDFLQCAIQQGTAVLVISHDNRLLSACSSVVDLSAQPFIDNT